MFIEDDYLWKNIREHPISSIGLANHGIFPSHLTDINHDKLLILIKNK